MKLLLRHAFECRKRAELSLACTNLDGDQGRQPLAVEKRLIRWKSLPMPCVNREAPGKGEVCDDDHVMCNFPGVQSGLVFHPLMHTVGSRKHTAIC